MNAAVHAIRPQRHAGFSLSELLVTVAIVAITAGVGLPMMSGFIDDAAVSSTADQAMAGLTYARSEAVKRNMRVTMCRSTNGSACAAPAAGEAEWRQGWIVFTDGGEAASVDGDDEILRVQGPLGGRGKLIGTGDADDYVSYTSNGQARLADGSALAGAFLACSESAAASRRRITLTPGTGWVGVQLLAPAASCTA